MSCVFNVILSFCTLNYRSHIDVDALALNVYALADGLARYLYNLSSVEGLGSQGAGLAVFPQVHSKYLASWLAFLSGHPRSPQLVTEDHPVVAGLQQVRGVCVCECVRACVRACVCISNRAHLLSASLPLISPSTSLHLLTSLPSPLSLSLSLPSPSVYPGTVSLSSRRRQTDTKTRSKVFCATVTI